MISTSYRCKQFLETEKKTRHFKTETMKTKMNLIAVALLTVFVISGISANAKGSKIKASGCENNVELSINLEAWMKNNEIWDVKSAENKTETNETLAIESWMIDGFNFDFSNFADAPIHIENWMIDENIWNSIGSDKVMAVEAWMTQESKWNVIR